MIERVPRVGTHATVQRYFRRWHFHFRESLVSVWLFTSATARRLSPERWAHFCTFKNERGLTRVRWRESFAEIGARPESGVVTIRYGAKRTRRRTDGSFNLLINRRAGRDAPSSRHGSIRGDGPGRSRRRRSNRCMRKDSIPRNRAQSQILQTHAREIPLRGTRRQRSLHESHHRGS